MQQKRQINKQKKSAEKVDKVIQELVERIRKEKNMNELVCCVCHEKAVIIDTDYDELYCHKHAREYEVYDGPNRLVRSDEVVRLDPSDSNATVCGTCGAAWDDRVITDVTPVPSGRCPFEYEHESE